MASLRETPRQKMIGLMYLVLLALLALQVSSAIMEKFRFLDDSLSFANSSAEENNRKLENRLATAVAHAGNKSADLQLLEKARKIKKQADQTKAYIQSLREELIAASGGFEIPQDKRSMYKGAKDEGTVEELMIGQKKAYELQSRINGYSTALKTITGQVSSFPFIALDAKDDHRISSSSEQKKKSFAELNFAQTPMVAAMAVLSNMESEVLKQEAFALEMLAGKVDQESIHFDQVEGMFKSESNTVVAGKKYKADVFLAAASSALLPKIEVEGQALKVDSRGVGSLEFSPKPGNYDQYGFSVRKWKGKITLNRRGKDTTFTVSGEYKVAKPYIEVQSDASVQLYRNCGNVLKIACPPLGADFRPSYEGSTGGSVLPKQGEPGKVVIVPTSPNVKLKVSSAGTFLEEKSYGVRLIPLPTFKLRNVDEKEGLRSPYPQRICLDIIPDESFQRTNPQDARYKADQVEVTVIRRRKAVVGPIVMQSGCIDLGFLRSTGIQPGDRLVIEVKKVLRKNFRDEVEEVNAGRILKNIPLE